MKDGLKTYGSLMPIDLTRMGTRAILALSVAVLSIVTVTLLGPGLSTTAQETSNCQIIDLGTLGREMTALSRLRGDGLPRTAIRVSISTVTLTTINSRLRKAVGSASN